ncbi:MAG: TIGR04222 domain-containing membrane protein [Erythrobacter sp.]|nr:TIGR04222 domain-containing membrane protein [Erythrobacter sp.]
MQLFSSWTGSDFLLFYIMLLGFSVAAAWWIPAKLRSAGRRSESADAEDVALLVNGRARYADSIIADLFARGGLNDYGGGKLFVCDAGVPASPAGRALLALREPFSRRQANRMLAIHASRTLARLRREGLMVKVEELSRLRWLSIMPFAALVLLGLYRQRAGSALGEATGYLVILLCLTVVLAVVRFIKFDARTVEGIAIVNHMRVQSSRLRRAPMADEAAMAVALFGTGVLVGTPWEPVHSMRHQGRSDSGSSDGGSDGGSGDGGCGGCGG